MDQNVYVLFAGGPNFSYFTTVIVISFEASTNGLTETQRSCWFIIFDFQQLLLLPKLIRPLVMELENARKADKSILVPIVVGYNLHLVSESYLGKI